MTHPSQEKDRLGLTGINKDDYKKLKLRINKK